jgi:hypothetical protein
MTVHAATVSDHDAPTTVATAPVSVERAASILGVSVTTVRRRIRAGAIRAEEARRPQGPVWLVYLPADLTSPTANDQAGAISDHPPVTTAATAPTTAGDAMIAYTQTLLAPLVAALERAQARVAELERENGRQAAELNTLRAQNDALVAPTVVQPPDPPGEPSAPWWHSWLRWWPAAIGVLLVVVLAGTLLVGR